MSRGPSTSPVVLEFFKKNANIEVTVEEICQSTGFNREQVQTAIVGMRSTDPTLSNRITVIKQGTIFRYSTKEVAEVWEHIKTTKTGTVILEGPDGSMYAARKVKFE